MTLKDTNWNNPGLPRKHKDKCAFCEKFHGDKTDSGFVSLSIARVGAKKKQNWVCLPCTFEMMEKGLIEAYPKPNSTADKKTKQLEGFGLKQEVLF